MPPAPRFEALELGRGRARNHPQPRLSTLDVQDAARVEHAGQVSMDLEKRGNLIGVSGWA